MGCAEKGNRRGGDDGDSEDSAAGEQILPSASALDDKCAGRAGVLLIGCGLARSVTEIWACKMARAGFKGKEGLQ